MNDKEIITLFYERSEAAIDQLDKKYGRLCRTVSYNILRSHEDAEECVNDSYLGAWNAIPPAYPDPLRTYICKIVRNLSLKLYAKNTAVKRNSIYDTSLTEIEECLSSEETPHDALEAKELAKIIEGFLDTLKREDRVIFVRRYWFCDDYKTIARRVGITAGSVSVKLTRIRGKMRVYLEERGVNI